MTDECDPGSASVDEVDAAATAPGATDASNVLSLSARIEGILFVADGPVSVSHLADVLEVTHGQVEQAVAELESALAGRALRLQRNANHLQLVTSPEAAPIIERFLGLRAQVRFSAAALETLAMVAYRQPVTRPEIDAIRGVSSDGVIRTLLSAGLIEEVGRAPTVGRPILFGTTFEFLQRFGLRSLYELPPLDAPAPAEEGGAPPVGHGHGHDGE